MTRALAHLARMLAHELFCLTVTPFSYVTHVLFLVLMGALYVSILHEYACYEYATAPGAVFFETFWLPNLIVIPALTMRSFAENRKTGALETMLSTRVGAGAWVGVKFASAYLAYALFWGSTWVYPLIARYSLSDGETAAHLIQWSPWLGGYSFILLSGLLFVALGIFFSAATHNAVTAGVCSFFSLLACFIGIKLLPKVTGLDMYIHPYWKLVVEYGDLFHYLEGFSTGLIDSRPFVLCISTACMLLWLSVLNVHPKR